jgi:hypothetical protein
MLRRSVLFVSVNGLFGRLQLWAASPAMSFNKNAIKIRNLPVFDIVCFRYTP